MLKRIFTLTILIMPFFLSAQTFNQDLFLFNNNSGQNQHVNHNNVIPLSNGRKIMMTTEFVGANPDDKGKSLRIVKLDNTDNKIWEKEFSVNRGTRMEKFSNKLYVVGFDWDKNQNIYRGQLLVLDLGNGSLLKQRKFTFETEEGYELNTHPTSLAVVKDVNNTDLIYVGGFASEGFVNELKPGDPKRSFVLGMDASNLSVLVSKSKNTSINYNQSEDADGISRIIELPEKEGLLLLGSRNTPNTNSWGFPIVQRVDYSLQTIWENPFSSSCTNGYFASLDAEVVTLEDDGGDKHKRIFVLGNTSKGHSLVISRYTMNGSLNGTFGIKTPNYSNCYGFDLEKASNPNTQSGKELRIAGIARRVNVNGNYHTPSFLINADLSGNVLNNEMHKSIPSAGVRNHGGYLAAYPDNQQLPRIYAPDMLGTVSSDNYLFNFTRSRNSAGVISFEFLNLGPQGSGGSSNICTGINPGFQKVNANYFGNDVDESYYNVSFNVGESLKSPAQNPLSALDCENLGYSISNQPKIAEAEASNSSNQSLKSQASNIRVYPNPLRGGKSLNLNLNVGKIQNIRIINAKGKKVKRMREIGNETQRIDMNDLKNGVYFLKIRTDQEKTYQRKIVNLN